MSEERTLAARGSEYFREASVLILVFGLLDPFFQGPAAHVAGLAGKFDTVELPWVLLVLVVSTALFFGGVALDYVRMGGSDEAPSGPPEGS